MLIFFLLSAFFILSFNFTLLEILTGALLLISGFMNFYSMGNMDFIASVMLILGFYLYFIFVPMSVKYMMAGVFKTYKHLVFLLVSMINLCFFFKSIWGFYIFFEFSLIPLILTIYWFGYQIERLQASFYLFFYTMLGSLPLLFFILWFMSLFSNSSFLMLEVSGYSLTFSKLISMSLTFIFFIKLPIFLFHLWLPKAHVEAPVMGSMVLAAILLKMGGYGLYRFYFLLSSSVKELLFFLCLWGALLSAFICLIQSDLKALVAYSSISHMGSMTAGFFLFSYLSMKGFLIILLSHAFCSSALFFLVNLVYERSLSRQTIYIRSFVSSYYYLMVFLFIFMVANFSAPPTFNLFGELILFISFVGFNFVVAIVLGFVAVMVAFYCIYAYSNISQGQAWPHKGFFAGNNLDWLVLIFHLIPVFLLVFFMGEL